MESQKKKSPGVIHRARRDVTSKGTAEHRTPSVQSRVRASFRPFIMPLLLLFCTVFYYFGELVNWTAWDALRSEFFYGVHDVHRLLFLVPIIYAGYNARVKGAVIVTLVSFVIFLPRAFFISPFPDPLLRMVLFTIAAGLIGSLTGVIRNQADRVKQLHVVVEDERNKLLNIIDSMADGILITGPNFEIRFMNSVMVKDFGDGTGLPCYKHIHKLDTHCEHCMIPDVINNKEVGKWKCGLDGNRDYEIVAAPYIDTDGVVCQLSIFRKVAGSKNV